MRLVAQPTAARGQSMPVMPLWPPLLATRGPGAASSLHAHHGMHLILGETGTLRVRLGPRDRWQTAPGLLTGPDVRHAVDGAGTQVLLVFIDPESAAGAALAATLTSPVRLLGESECARLRGADPMRLMSSSAGAAWIDDAATLLGAPAAPRPRPNPRVRKLLSLLQDRPPEADDSLAALAAAVGWSPGRLMHAFTESIGIPLRPYLAWLRLQRAAGAIVGGATLADAAYSAGFSDAAHMSRTFRRMLGMPPSVLAGRS
jgi:AraC-like DNA-binding protein